MKTRDWKPMPMLTDEQHAAALRGEAVEIIPAPGEGKRIRILDGAEYVIEKVP